MTLLWFALGWLLMGSMMLGPAWLTDHWPQAEDLVIYYPADLPPSVPVAPLEAIEGPEEWIETAALD